MLSRGPSCLIALLLFLSSCTSDGFSLLVELRTDLVAGVELGEVELTIDTTMVPRHAVDQALDYVAGVRVAEVEGLETGSHLLTAALFAPDGSVVVLRRVRIELRGNQGVTIIVTRDCRGVTCPTSSDPSATACLAGRCIDERCTPEDPATCPAPECAADSDCTTSTPCAVGRCSAGACLFEDDGSCPALEYCDPDMGCRALPGATDGATPDSSVPDGSSPTCSDGICDGLGGESCIGCPADCDTRADVCGNGECSATESSVTCMPDCGPDPWPTEWADFGREFFDEINVRRAAGVTCPSGFIGPVGPVTINTGLQRAAELHAWERASFPLSPFPDGESCNGRTILDRAMTAGVSIAGQYTTILTENDAATAVNDWETSSLCEALLMNDTVTEVGPGVAVPGPAGAWTVMLR